MSDSVINSNPENKRIDFNMIYPFMDKPKIVPLLKKAIAGIFLLGCLFWYSTHLVAAYLVSNSLEINKLFYEVKITALTTGAIQTVEFQELDEGLMTVLKKKVFMKSLEKSLMYVLPLLMFYFLYQAFKKERYDKNIYSVSGLYLILSLFYFALIGFTLFWKENLFYNDFPYSINKMKESSVTFIDKDGITRTDFDIKLIVESKGLAVISTFPSFVWINKVILNEILIWQLVRAANIVMLVVLFINIILLILLFILKPKIDKEKIAKIQQEIRKKAEANLVGKEYQMDSSIF